MNIKFIYEGNEYEFDVYSNITIAYIKEIAEKIFQYKEKGLDIIFNDENLTNYNDKLKINEINKENEKELIFQLEKKDFLNKNNNISNGSTNDTNDNDKYIKTMKEKFNQINQNYSKINNKIYNFDERLNESIEKLKKQIKEFKNNILKVNETLNSFEKKESYEKLILFFDNKIFNEKPNLNKELETCNQNLKYLSCQYDFQIKVISFIQQIKNKFKASKIKLSQIQKLDNSEEIISILDEIFYELLSSTNFIEPTKTEYYNNINEKFLNTSNNKDSTFPLIDISNSKEKTIKNLKLNQKEKKLIKQYNSDLFSKRKKFSL